MREGRVGEMCLRFRRHVSVLLVIFEQARRKAGEVGAGRPAATGRMTNADVIPSVGSGLIQYWMSSFNAAGVGRH